MVGYAYQPRSSSPLVSTGSSTPPAPSSTNGRETGQAPSRLGWFFVQGVAWRGGGRIRLAALPLRLGGGCPYFAVVVWLSLIVIVRCGCPRHNPVLRTPPCFELLLTPSTPRAKPFRWLGLALSGGECRPAWRLRVPLIARHAPERASSVIRAVLEAPAAA